MSLCWTIYPLIVGFRILIIIPIFTPVKSFFFTIIRWILRLIIIIFFKSFFFTIIRWILIVIIIIFLLMYFFDIGVGGGSGVMCKVYLASIFMIYLHRWLLIVPLIWFVHSLSESWYIIHRGGDLSPITLLLPITFLLIVVI